MQVTLPLPIDPAHPAFAGHFPDRPILPGVVLLDTVMRAIERQLGSQSPDASDSTALLLRQRLSVCKFHQPAGPGAQLLLHLDFKPHGAVAFSITDQATGASVASGSFAAPQPL